MISQIIIVTLFIITILLIYINVSNRNKYIKLEKNKIELKDKYSLCLKDIKQLQEEIDYYEEKEYMENNGYNTINGPIKKQPIYKGKKALIGDYNTWSARNTKKVLKSLGFKVDIVANSKDIIKKIKSNEKYDVIFSNNIYKDGTGAECLKELKEIEGFSIPVIIHTATKNKRDYFINTIGFDDYIVKPVSQEKVMESLERLIK